MLSVRERLGAPGEAPAQPTAQYASARELGARATVFRPLHVAEHRGPRAAGSSIDRRDQREAGTFARRRSAAGAQDRGTGGLVALQLGAHGRDDLLGADPRDRGEQALAGQPGPAAGADDDADPGERGDEQAGDDAADHQHGRRREAPPHDLRAAAGAGGRRAGTPTPSQPSPTRTRGDEHPLQHPDRAPPAPVPVEVEVGGRHGAVERVGRPAPERRVVARTASDQPRRSPSDASSASVRSAVSTRACCTPDRPGSEVRDVGVGEAISLRRAGLPSRSRRSGSGLNLATQASTGHPVARPPRSRQAWSTASRDHGHARRPRRAGRRASATVRRVSSGAGSVPEADASRAATRADVGGEPGGGGPLAGDDPGQPGEQGVQALAGRGGDARAPRPRPAPRRRAAGAGRAGRRRGRPGVSVSTWLSTTSITAACPASGRR